MLHIQSFRCLFSHSDFRAAETGEEQGREEEEEQGRGKTEE